MANLVYQLALDAETGQIGDRVIERIGNAPGLAGDFAGWPAFEGDRIAHVGQGTARV